MYNFTKLDATNASVQGRDFLIEDKTTGKVYLTSKGYIDKLFDEMGYRNLNVIKVLEEFAGKFVSDIGSLRESDIYIDDSSSTFVVLPEASLNWINTFFEKMKDEGIKIVSSKKFDDYHTWDQYLVETKDHVFYMLYFNLREEYVEAYIMDLNETNDIVYGMKKEADYYFKSPDDMSSLLLTMMTPASIKSEITLDEELSMYEYAEVMKFLGYLKSKRGQKYVMTDEGEESVYKTTLETFIDDISVLSWIQRRINSSNVKFKDMCKIIGVKRDDICWSNLYWFFEGNIYEKSDIFSLNK